MNPDPAELVIYTNHQGPLQKSLFEISAAVGLHQRGFRLQAWIPAQPPTTQVLRMGELRVSSALQGSGNSKQGGIGRLYRARRWGDEKHTCATQTSADPEEPLHQVTSAVAK